MAKKFKTGFIPRDKHALVYIMFLVVQQHKSNFQKPKSGFP